MRNSYVETVRWRLLCCLLTLLTAALLCSADESTADTDECPDSDTDTADSGDCFDRAEKPFTHEDLSKIFGHNGPTSESYEAPYAKAHGSTDNGPNSRKKRFIYFTSQRKLSFPPTTVVATSLSINLPLARDLPAGYSTSMTISVPFGFALDELGLTSEENPWGLWPFLSLITRKKRSNWEALPGVNWAGGDREMVYLLVENYLHNLGMNGHQCLLRAICEMFEMPLHNHGFVGELLEVFLSPSRAPWATLRLKPYLEAERHGRITGECWRYYKGCKHSLFTINSENDWRQKQKKETEEEAAAVMEDDKEETNEPSATETPKKEDKVNKQKKRISGSVKKDLAARNATIAYAEDSLE